VSRLLSLSCPTKADLTIDYMLTFRCNYDCSYCTSHDIEHPMITTSAEKISNALNYVSDLYNKNNVSLLILGGEPLLYKDFSSILDKLNDNISPRIITNLSASLSYLKKNFTKFSNKLQIRASYHAEYADPDIFIEKILYLHSLRYDIKSSVAIHYDNKLFDKSIYVLESLKKLATPMILSKMGEKNQTFGNHYPYSKYQLNKLEEYNTYSKAFKAVYDDKIINYSYHDIVSKNKDNFKGMKCHAGHEKVHIKENGDVYPSACFLNTSVCLGNMFKKTIKKPTAFVTCPFTFCRCNTDLEITKQAQI
jgi:sulfatase maturation enzyme AslB (radical SAM superfamily)